MPRIALLLALASVFSAGCVLAPRGHLGSSRQAMVSGGKSCPSGHVWSDGRCHARGKGHDPAKHQGKGKKK